MFATANRETGFAAFKKAASLVDALPLPVLQPPRVEPKPRTGIWSSTPNHSGELQRGDQYSSTKASHERIAEEILHGSGILGLTYGNSDDEEESDPGHNNSLRKDIISKSARCAHGRPFPADGFSE